MNASFIEEDAAESEVDSDALVRIAVLARLLADQQKAVAAAESQLQLLKEEMRRTETEDLPELMKELGLSEVKLEDGSKVEVKPDVQCGITEDRRPAAHAWLEAHGFGGLIKTELRLGFDRDEREAAKDMAKKIAQEFEREVEFVDAVHPGTLKSFIKEQMALGAEGSNPPKELFGIFPYNKAKVTPPKAPKPSKARKPRA